MNTYVFIFFKTKVNIVGIAAVNLQGSEMVEIK